MNEVIFVCDSCEFDSYLEYLMFLFPRFDKETKARSGVPPLNIQYLKNSVKNGELS